MNQKKQFVFVLFILIVLLIISFVLATVFSDYGDQFGPAAGFFLIAIVILFEAKNALNPLNGGAVGNFVLRRYYNRIGKLEEYRKVMISLFIAVTCLAIVMLEYGILKLVFSKVLKIVSNFLDRAIG